MTLTIAYWAAFLCYSAAVIGIGLYFWRQNKSGTRPENTADFWSAGRGLSGWSSGLSISASMMSISWSCVYGVQLFYWYGIGGAWLLIIPWLITMGGFYLFAPTFRKLQAFSQPELLEKRFGRRARQLLAPALIFVFTVWGGAEIYAAGITIAPFLNISVPMTLLLIALVVATYSFTGGFAAVVSTDKVQFALVAMFITVMAVVGCNAVFNTADASALLAATHIAPKNLAAAPWWLSPGFSLVALTFLAYLPGWLVETDVWIRLQAAKSDAEARKGVLVASLNSLLFIGLLPMLIGLAALVLYPPVNGIVPENIQDGALIFNALMRDYTPFWLNVLLGIGLVAAAMSTIDTCANVVALSFSYDILEPHLAENSWQPPQLAALARWISVAAVFVAFVYALFTESLWDIFYLSSGILSTTVFLPVVAVFLRNSTARQVYFATAAGFIGTLVGYFAESRGWVGGIEPQWLAETQLGYILFGMGCSILTFLIGRGRQSA
jgi:Na+/proline symporter